MGNLAGDPSPPPLGHPASKVSFLLLMASLATVGVGLWLWAAIAFVLPARDPATIPLWRTIAASLLGYSALTWACLFFRAGAALLRRILLVASALAVVAGSYGVAAMLLAAGEGRHFEGYILLMGLILIGHGASGLLYLRRSPAAGRGPSGAPTDAAQ